MKRRALVELLLALALLVVALAAYSIWYVAVGKASAEAAALSEEIRAKGIDSARVAGAKAALESLAADEETMRSYLVRETDVVSFLERLEDAGGSLGTEVEVVSVGAESTNGRAALKLSLRIVGSFDGVLRTLGALEYGPYDTRMQNVTLDTTAGENGASGVWTATATLLIGTRQ